jgi:hypothetical protein
MFVKEYDMNPSREIFYLFGEAQNWWMSIDKDTIWNLTWEECEKLFSDKCIKNRKMEAMYIIQDELKEEKEKVYKLQKENEGLRKYIIKKDDEFAKMQSLNESLIKEVKNIKKENISDGKLEKMIQGKNYKRKMKYLDYETIIKKLLDEVKRLK